MTEQMRKAKRKKERRKESRVGKMAGRGPTARHPLQKDRDVTQRAKQVPTQRTPEEFAKLSPAQRLFVEKGIVASSIAGAKKMEATFKEKEATAPVVLPSEPPAGAEPVLPQEEPSLEPEAPAQEEPSLFEKATAFGLPPGEDVAGKTMATAVLALTTALAPAAILGTSVMASGGLAAPTVMRAAGGKLAKDTGKVILGKAATNTKTAKLVTSFLTKLTAHKRFQQAVYGTIVSTIGLWGVGKWGQAEGIEGLEWEYARAVDDGEYELAEELDKVYQEAIDVSMWEEIKSFLPLIQIPITAERIDLKLEAAKAKHKTTNAKLARITSGELTPEEQKWADIRKREAEKDAFFATLREEAAWR